MRQYLTKNDYEIVQTSGRFIAIMNKNMKDWLMTWKDMSKERFFKLLCTQLGIEEYNSIEFQMKYQEIWYQATKKDAHKALKSNRRLTLKKVK